MKTSDGFRDDYNNDEDNESIWHLVAADFFAGKSLIYLTLFLSIISYQSGLLKVQADANHSGSGSGAPTVELHLDGGGKLWQRNDGGYEQVSPLDDVSEMVKGRRVVFHPAAVVVTSSYGADTAKLFEKCDKSVGVVFDKALDSKKKEVVK